MTVGMCIVVCVIYVCLNDITVCCLLFFKQKTAYEMRISDLSSDVCSSDLWQKINAPNNGFYKNGLFGSNDLEPVVFAKHPVVEQAVKCLSEQIGRASCRERVCQYV